MSFWRLLGSSSLGRQKLSSWADGWFDAHVVFVYETFPYIVAALLKTKSYRVLYEMYKAPYLRPGTDGEGRSGIDRFDSFYGTSDVLQAALAPEGRRLYSPAAELVKRHADRQDLPFQDVQQADLMTTFVACLNPGTFWYPQTLLYWPRYRGFPFFIKAAHRRHFRHLAAITGVEDANRIRSVMKEGTQIYDGATRGGFGWPGMSIGSLMNLENLDTIE